MSSSQQTLVPVLAGAIAIVSVLALFTAVSEKFEGPLPPIAACLIYPAPPETMPLGALLLLLSIVIAV